MYNQIILKQSWRDEKEAIFYSDVWIKTKDTHTNNFGKQNGHTGINSSTHKAGQNAHQQVRPFRLVQSQNFSERNFWNFFRFLQENFF